LHAKHWAELRAKIEASALRDPLEALGATRREASSGADEIAFSLDLPAPAFEPWCRLEQRHLQRLALFQFPIERERLILELEKGYHKAEEALSILLGTALSGHPYAQTYDLQKGSLEGLTWSGLRAFAHTLFSPERMTLVLVGDLKLEAALPALEASFGALTVAQEGRGRREDRSVELPQAPGYRRLQASTAGEPHFFAAWRIPPANHPDDVALRILAQVLGGSKGSRLIRRIQEERGLARRISVRVGVPGGRDPSLFIIEVRPADGHGLAEIEEALHGEILRIQREFFPEEEIRRAQRQMETESLMVQEDAASLARMLGRAVAQSGDWHQAFRVRSLGRDLTQEEIQGVARRYLVPGQGISALLEADPLLAPRDSLEEKLGKILTILVQRKLEDPALVEAVVRETLRQVRMLSVSEREQTIKLLEAQTGS
jgi:zinc protease